MSDHTSFEVRLYSPRWGHEDTYKINLDREQMKVEGKGLGKNAVCSLVEGRDPQWSGYNDSIGNPLDKILENDSIYPPTVFVRALESAWDAWRDGTLDDNEILKEVQELCEWVNEVFPNKTKTDFWRKIF